MIPALFHSWGENIITRDLEIKSAHCLSSVADTESRPGAFLLHNLFSQDKMCNQVTRRKLKQQLAWLTNSSKEVPTSSVSLDSSGPFFAKNLLKPSAISIVSFEGVIVVGLYLLDRIVHFIYAAS